MSRRAALTLAPCLASCGLLMDFEPGAGGEGGGDPTSVTTSSSGIGPGSSASDAASTSTGSTGSTGASSGGGGAGGEGGEGGGPRTRPWSAVLGGISDDELSSMAVSPEGRVAVAGTYRDVLDAAGTELDTDPARTGTFLVAFDPSGTPYWVRRVTQYDGKEHDDISLAYDGEDLVIAGSFASELTIQEPTVENTGAPSGFVAKVSKLGTVAWSHPFGDVDEQRAKAVAVEGGRIFVTGYFCGGFELAGCDPVPSIDCQGGFNLDGFVARLGSGGECEQLVTFTGSGHQMGLDIDVSAQGGIALAGIFDGTFTFGGESGSLVPASTDNPETFLALLDEEMLGVRSWSLGPLGTSGSSVRVLMKEGSVLRFHGTLVGPLLGTGKGGAGSDFFAGTTDGGDVAVQTWISSPNDDAGLLRQAPDGTLHAYGTFRDVTRFGAGISKASNGTPDAFATVLESDGEPPSADVIEVFGNRGDEAIVAAGFDAAGHEVVAGVFDEDFSVDVQTLEILGGGSRDVFVVAR